MELNSLLIRRARKKGRFCFVFIFLVALLDKGMGVLLFSVAVRQYECQKM
jgi:hypothetical protein